jgi:hypothetical protein
MFRHRHALMMFLPLLALSVPPSAGAQTGTGSATSAQTTKLDAAARTTIVTRLPTELRSKYTGADRRELHVEGADRFIFHHPLYPLTLSLPRRCPVWNDEAQTAVSQPDVPDWEPVVGKLVRRPSDQAELSTSPSLMPSTKERPSRHNAVGVQYST